MNFHEIDSRFIHTADRRDKMHNVKLIRRHFPNHQRKITAVALAFSLSSLLVGLGLLFLR
jgi:hypothetical protein